MNSLRTPPCLYCGNVRIRKDGHRAGRQLYECQECGRQSSDKGAVFGHHFPPEVIGEAITHFYHGMSYAQVVQKMSESVGFPPLSRETVRRWVTTYTEAALLRLDGVKASAFGAWVAVDMPASLRNGKEWWAWFVFDLYTLFALACYLSRERNAMAAATALHTAASFAIEPPLFICSDSSDPYADALPQAFPDATPEAIVHKPQTRYGLQTTGMLPPRLVEFLQGQANRAVHTRNQDRGMLHLKGWLLSFNFMEGFQIEPGKTPPCLQVGLSSHLTNWQSVAKLGPAREYEPR